MVEFSKDKWNKIKLDSNKWWKGELGRPLIQARLDGNKPNRLPSQYPAYSFTSFYDLSVPPEMVVDAWDYQLCCTKHLGDAFPVIFPNFGAGVMAAYLGIELKNAIDKDTVWFHPQKDLHLNDLALNYQPDNKWLKRTKQILEAAVEKWQSTVQIAMTDLGGSMDVLSSFRPGEKLMFDLYDHSEKVKELNWEAHHLWWKYFNELNAIVSDSNQGFSTWARIFSKESHYMLQCDFCYMISPDMFEDFVKPELKATADQLINAFYHLDGPGQLTHLDSLLEINSIKGVQWIPGAGQPEISEWPEVYKKITNAGKKIHIMSNQTSSPFTILDEIAQQTGNAENIVYHFDGHISQLDQVEKMLSNYI